MSAILSREQVRGAVPVFLLTITWAEREYLFSTEPIVITKDDGSTLPFRGGLNDPEYAESFDRLTVSVDGQSIPFQVVFPEDVPARIRAGYPLGLARGELSMVLVRRGVSLQAWEDRFPMVSGNVSRPQWAHPLRPAGWAAFSLKEEGFDDATPILDPSWRITHRTWPNHDTAHTGKSYPLPWGIPGLYVDEDGNSTLSPGSPAYRVDTEAISGDDIILISAEPVRASLVRVFDADGNSDTYSVTHREDGLGKTTAICDISVVTPGGITNTSPEFWVSFGLGSEGGVVNPFSPNTTLELGGEVLRYFMRRSRMVLDHGSWEAALSAAQGGFLRTAGFVNDPAATVWSFCRENLLPLLSMSVRRTPTGLVPIPRLSTRPLQSLPLIHTGLDFQIASPESESRQLSDVVNDLTIEFAYLKGKSGNPQRQRRISPLLSVSGRVPDQAAEASANLYGHRPGRTMTSHLIASVDAADRVLRNAIYEQGFIPTELTVQAHARFGWLRVGQEFALASETLHLTRRRATVLSRSWNGPRQVWELGLELRNDTLEALLETA